MAGEIFISYRRADQAKAGLLYQLLKDRGVDAWYDALLDAGDDWRYKTANALVAAPIFVLLFSKAAAQSDDISKELAAATFQKKTVIPVRIDNIHPEGAFLYELASRNWFDAYEDTEARLAVLADRLAAVVKGGADAKAAALKLGAPIDVIPVAKEAAAAEPAAPSVAKPLLKQPVILAGIAAVAVALIAGAAFFLQPKAPETAASQRVAFFGFTATDDDPASRNIAAIATDEAFTSLGLRRIETVARADAVIPAGATRLDRASQIGARYALSGDLRRDGDLARFAMRFEDVSTRSTLWEINLERPINETTPTAFAAADAAVRLANCFSYSAFTDVTGPRDPRAVPVVANACGGLVATNPQRYIQGLREMAEMKIGGPDLDGALAFRLAGTLTLAPPSSKGAMRTEIEAALARASKSRPDSFATAAAQALAGASQSVLPSEWIPPVEKALQRAPKPGEAFWYAANNQLAAYAMWSAGRLRDAQSYVKAALEGDPLVGRYVVANAVLISINGAAYSGAIEGWDQTLLGVLKTRPSESLWEIGLSNAIFSGTGDVEALFAMAPATLESWVVPCYRDLQASLKLTGAPARLAASKNVEDCLTRFDSPHMVLQAASTLGDLDVAFAQMDTPEKANRLIASYMPTWFNPAARAMRADPRFMPLMERLGYVDYWKQSQTRPDVCDTPEERDIPVCMALRQDAVRER